MTDFPGEVRSEGVGAPNKSGKVVALSGGVGGAKLASGLEQVVADRLVTIVNTGDDFRHLGLLVSPDIDSVVYAMSGRNDRVRGWGRFDESWKFMETLREINQETWFQLGDRDLGMHVARTHCLATGQQLSDFTRDVCSSLGIRGRVIPMTDDNVSTCVRTEQGTMEFQTYFVKHRCEPRVVKIEFEGAATSSPTPGLLDELADPHLDAVILCPSNPYLSMDPILSVRGLREAISRCAAPVVAVSPLVGREALKGPTTKIMRELGVEVSNASICAHYADVLDGIVIDTRDAGDAALLPVPTWVTDTTMLDGADQTRLAREVLHFCTLFPKQRAPRSLRVGH